MLRSIAIIGLFLCFAESAAAQINDIFGRLGGFVQSAIVQATQAEWSKLSQSELDCVDGALRGSGTSLRNIIQQGTLPADPRLSGVRTVCRNQISPSNAPASTRAAQPVYRVDGIALGEMVRQDSAASRQLHCAPSNQIPGFTWCQKQRSDIGTRGPFSVAISILHSADGKAVYVNQYIQPAYFGGDDISAEIDRLAKKFGQTPNVIHMTLQNGLPDATIATWGNITLEPLRNDERANIASGGHLKNGIPMDYLGDFQKSAKLGLPIFQIAGGEGYIWSASFDRDGRGHLRILEANPSLFRPVDTASTSPKAPIPTPSNDTPRETEQATAQPDAASEQDRIAEATAEADKRRVIAETTQAEAERRAALLEQEAKSARLAAATAKQESEQQAKRLAEERLAREEADQARTKAEALTAANAQRSRNIIYFMGAAILLAFAFTFLVLVRRSWTPSFALKNRTVSSHIPSAADSRQEDSLDVPPDQISSEETSPPRNEPMASSLLKETNEQPHAKTESYAGDYIKAEGQLWFYSRDGAKIGPVGQSEILELMRTGKIGKATLLWHSGMGEWVNAEESVLWGLIASSAAPPPLPASQVNNKLAWLVVAVPILGMIGLTVSSFTSLFESPLSCTSKANHEAVLGLVKEHPFEILAKDKRLETSPVFIKYSVLVAFASALGNLKDSDLTDALAKFYEEADIVIDPMLIGTETGRQSQCSTYAHLVEKNTGARFGNIRIEVALTKTDEGVAINIRY